MIYAVRVFGPFGIVADDGSDTTPGSRKARALLAYCILSSPKAVRREQLTELLWGDRGEEQARASLRQALYEMRELTSGEAPLLIVDRGTVRVDPAQTNGEIEQLQATAKTDDARAMAALIGAAPEELLTDLTGVSAEFDEWLLAERVHRRDQRRSLALEVAERAMAAADPAGARQIAHALVAADPLDETAARTAMTASAALGDSDDARRVFRRIEAALRKELDIAPSQATVSTYQQLLIEASSAPLQLLGEAHPRSSIASETTSAPLPQWYRRMGWRQRTFAVLGVAAILAITGWFTFMRPGDSSKRLLMVEQLRAPAGDRSALLLRQSLSNDLTRMIVGNDTTLNFVAAGDEAGSRPQADYVVSGEAQSSAGQLHATVRLTDGRNAIILWSRDFSGPSVQLDALRQQMASKIAEVLVCALGSRSRRPANIDVATLRLYLAGCENWHTDWPAARKFFGQVIQREPGFAQARGMYAAMTDQNTGTFSGLPREAWEPLLREAKAEAQKALAQDPHVGAAYFALVASSKGLQNWPERQAVLEKGIAADPAAGELHTAMGVGLGNIGMTGASTDHFAQAWALDPFAPIYASNLAEAYSFGDRIPDGARLLKDAGEFWPGEFYTGWTRFEVAARVGDAAQAEAMLDNSAMNPDTTQAQAMIDHGTGNSGYAPERQDLWRLFIAARMAPSPANVEKAKEALLAADGPKMSTQGKLEIVQDLVQIGKIDDAYAVAQRMGPVSEFWGFGWFRSYMAPFRADPRFLSLMEKQELLPLWKRTHRWPDFCHDPGLRYRCPQEARLHIRSGKLARPRSKQGSDDPPSEAWPAP